jgi:hypothetical protein
MQARIVAPSHGARWLAEGWQLFRAAPLAWLALVFTYIFLTQLLAAIPLVGPLAAAMLVPAFSVGLMSAARAASGGARIEVTMLFDGLRRGARAQLVLGAVYAACVLLVLAGATAIAGQGVADAALEGEQRPALDRGQVASMIAAVAALYAPVMMLFWFAPVLAAWHAAPPAKALFFSFFAFLMNWRAFLVYGAASALAVALVPLAAAYLLGALGGGLSRPAANAVVVALVLVVMPTLFGSFYASYREVFGASAGPA